MMLKSPINDIHEKLNAKFTDFAGFRMPIYYSSIKNDHLSNRSIYIPDHSIPAFHQAHVQESETATFPGSG